MSSDIIGVQECFGEQPVVVEFTSHDFPSGQVISALLAAASRKAAQMEDASRARAGFLPMPAMSSCTLHTYIDSDGGTVLQAVFV